MLTATMGSSDFLYRFKKLFSWKTIPMLEDMLLKPNLKTVCICEPCAFIEVSTNERLGQHDVTKLDIVSQFSHHFTIH